jgi:predicted dehydrogenase
MRRNALVVGYGHMGRFHRTALHDLGYSIHTVDPRPAAGADWQHVPAGYSFHAVCIATPIEHLAEHAAAWAGRTNHLLIEKPMAATHEEAVELAKALGSQLTAVGYVERFNPQVRQLKQRIAVSGAALSATFHRWNDRPSSNPALDLTSHDIDLAHHLDIPQATYDTRVDVPLKRRQIDVTTRRCVLHADLLDHSTSPLHLQWRALIVGRPTYATPQDAIRVLAHLTEPAAIAA